MAVAAQSESHERTWSDMIIYFSGNKYLKDLVHQPDVITPAMSRMFSYYYVTLESRQDMVLEFSEFLGHLDRLAGVI